MGLFDFIKDIGMGMGKGDEHLEQEIKDAVQKAGLDIKDFSLKMDHTTAVIVGTAGSLKDAEMARLLAGNHKGVEKVNDDGLKVVPATPTPLINGGASAGETTSAGTTAASSASNPMPASAPARMVTVKKGDTLSKIAKTELGNANRYPEIFEANRPMLKDPDEIFPGQVLRIPASPSEGFAARS